MLPLAKFSAEFKVRRLSESDIDIIFKLCRTNDEYYRYCPPMITKQAIISDLKALPQGKTMKDKYFIGYFYNDELLAIMDLIDGYPEQGIIFIGLFMVDHRYQNRGYGKIIIQEFIDYFRKNNYRSLRLAWIKENGKAEHFWLDQGFTPIKDTVDSEGHAVVLAGKELYYVTS